MLTSQITDFHSLGGSAQVHQAVSRALSADTARATSRAPASDDRDDRASDPERAGDGDIVQGGLYTLNTRLLRDLRPDLILTQDLCEVCSIDLTTVERVAAGMRPPPRVLSLNPKSFEDVLDDIYRVGEAIGREDRAIDEVSRLRERYFEAANFVNPFTEGPRVVFLEWTDPPFVGGHWTPQLVERAGASHPLNPTAPLEGSGAGEGQQAAFRVAGKSIAVDPEVIVAVRPEVVIVCPCGLDLETTRAEVAKIADRDWWKDLPAVRDGRVALVDGNQMFNRPGPRLVEAYRWLVGYLNGLPDLIPEGFPWERWGG